jgi:tRNA threonylcarbamoyladenosine biosynthesis protein TsaB
MIILTLRTDKPEAEIGLYNDQTQLAYEVWQAHRQLAETIHAKIRDLLASQAKDWADIQGIVVYRGPGSFTGLRIGVSIANTLAYSLDIPIIATDNDWIEKGIATLQTNPSKTAVVPEYGRPATVTTPKK